MILARKNPYNGLDYINDPAIMSWQLGNEPRGNNNTEAFNNWIDSTASLIKSIDPHHLVSTGCEGETPWPEASGLDFVRNHDGKNIDYLTVHIWVQNWSWYDPAGNEQSYQEAKNKMKTYLDDHIEKSKKIGKPMVVEEFGLARDRGTFDPAGTTNIKNDYYETVFNEVYKAAQEGAPVAGANFWAWAGEARPLKPYGSLWKVNDPFLGDPPHEQQGWYSVYDSDSATVKVISAYATRLSGLNK
jgi:mannan endo-1,4-beta-mannosidase